MRDAAADRRDGRGDARDDLAHVRDLASTRRDDDACSRDAAARRRDAEAEAREQRAGPDHADEVVHSSAARRAAASDRRGASQDRVAGAGERVEAGRDRGTSEADRSRGAAERGQAGRDRGASAQDREDASLDGLTQTYVRGPGMLQLAREVLRAQRTGERLTVAFVDVDGLKAVNDAGGHAAGDRLLRRVAAALRSRLRPYDLVVRYGGDEFVCVLTGVDDEEAQRRFRLVDADLAPDGSVSVGVVTARPGEGPEALVERADATLYALRTGRRPQD